MKFSFENRKPQQDQTVPESGKDSPDLSRRGFLLGRPGFEKEENVIQKEVDSVVLGEAQPEQETVSVEKAKISRRNLLGVAATSVLGGGIVGKGGIILHDASVSFLDDVGGVEGLKAIKKGVVEGRLARYVAERQEEAIAQEQLEEELARYKEEFVEKYHIPVVFEENPHHQRKDVDATSSEAHLQSKVKALYELLAVFRRYPDFMIESLHIPSITVRSNLKLTLKSADGFAFYRDHSVALDVNDDVWRSVQGYSTSVSGTVHHELFHLLDPIGHSEGAQVIPTLDQWHDIALVQPVTYRGESWQQKDYDGDRPPGFARDYGRKDILEDRATIFEAMMHGELPKDFESDPVLLAKVKKINEEIFFRSRGALRFNFAYSSFNYLDQHLRWMKQLASTDRQAMALREPIFKKVSDEEYASWQEYYRSRLAKK